MVGSMCIWYNDGCMSWCDGWIKFGSTDAMVEIGWVE